MTHKKEFAAGRGYTPEDWDAVSDNPEWTAADFAAARPFSEALPELATKLRRAGRPVSPNPKKQVTLRLDADVLEAFRATGTGWQGRINEVLRKSSGL